MSKKAKKINEIATKQAQKVVSSKKTINVYTTALICFLFAFMLYSNTLKHDYVLDDYGAVADNWVVKKGVQGIPIILTTTYRYGINLLSDNLYRPLSQIMFAIEWQVSPNNPSLSHIINVLFYALSCFLLFIVLRKYMSKVHPVIPLAITLLFAAHPIHTEVVANIKSRDEIMSFFFLLLTMLLLHIWFTKKKWWSLIASMLMLFLAFLSKEGIITMLFLFPFFGWYFTNAKRKTIITASILLIIPAIIYIAIRHQIISKFNATSAISITDNFLVAAPDTASRFATAIMLLGKYLILTVVPYQLVSDYSFNQTPIIGLGDLRFIIPFMVYLAMGIYVVLNLRKKNMIAFGFLFFLITTSIYSNILFIVGTSFGERFMFLPSLGLCMAFVFFITQWLKISASNNESEIDIIKSKPIFTTICVLILFLFAFKTIVRAAEWKNQSTLFEKDVTRSPNSAHMHLYWGLALRDKAMKEDDIQNRNAIMLKAVAEFDKGILIYPKYTDCYEHLGLAWYRLKDINKSLFNYETALKLNPNKAVTWNNTGIIYFEQGNLQKAMEVYKKSLSLDPNFSDAHLNLGSILGTMGKFQEAIEEFKKCIQFDPENIMAHKYIGITYKSLNNPEEAKIWLEKAQMLEQKKPQKTTNEKTAK
ncbi:MAG: tetratricopeptide repeat protein [Bacteroidetes bacterium]|nr:tetratricopeptide repeat protein [Bacteroidota bacterium]